MDVKYPIGKFIFEGKMTSDVIHSWISELEDFPILLNEAVKDLTEEQLDTPYREGGWTVRQVVHHLADSHMNAYIRFKLTLTEESPVIKPYDEAQWAEFVDNELPIGISLSLLQSLHIRLVKLLNSLTPEELKKTFIHLDSGIISIEKNIGLYVWHGKHHLAHITNLCIQQGWSSKGLTLNEVVKEKQYEERITTSDHMEKRG
ncbi:putative metal-dependent hydrolase [Psychrobacillus vulpis]|uniref:Putative metal-dependent hydrolase FG384_05835 n=1 Tax=Psychrobacillus vulpis TaxID=2325572 RepID=A0A544TT35_9BACI|nr:putative metal-dependent hydrolase [Psychrobacillus vulpis]